MFVQESPSFDLFLLCFEHNLSSRIQQLIFIYFYNSTFFVSSNFFETKANKKESSGLYYKTITIVIMPIVSDATIWSVIYNRN